jgi:peroxiredoxin
MTITINEKFPSVTMTLIVKGNIESKESREFFNDQKFLLVGVPGAFTPTCHGSHLPGYVENLSRFISKDINVIFISVNDPFVVQAWADSSNANDITMIADGNCALTNELGLTMDGSAFGLGDRCKRFAMLIEGGIVSSIDIEEPGALEVSSAEYQLAKI